MKKQNKYDEKKVRERLRELRKEAGYTQQELADMFMCSRECISYYETGSRELTLDILLRYSEVFNVSTDYILFGEPPKLLNHILCDLGKLIDKYNV